MKKLLVLLSCLLVFTLVGCQSKNEEGTNVKKEATLEKVDESVLSQYQYEEPQGNKEIIYSLQDGDSDYMYIVFKNMDIDCDKVTLEKDGTTYTINFGKIKQIKDDLRYVFKYSYNQKEDEPDRTIRLSDGEKEYVFDTSIVTDYKLN